ncbi:UNVERIFIED_ORG: integrase [Rhodococcus erythropolis]
MATIESYKTANGTRYQVRYRKPDGKQTKKRGFEKKKAAEAFANTVEVQKLTGNYVDPTAGKVTVGKLGESWSRSRSGLTENTRAASDIAFRIHVLPKWGTKAISQIKPSEVKTWVAEMEDAGVGTATIEKALGVFRQIMDAAVDDLLIAGNPCRGAKAPKRKHVQRGYLTHQQVHQLAAEVTTHGLVVLFLAYTGLRWGEMAALKVGSIDLDRQRVNVTEAVAEVKGKLVWGNAKTHERRTVPFPEFLAEPLAEQMRGKSQSDLVFPGEQGAVLRVSLYRPRIFALAVARCRGVALRERAKQKARDEEVTYPEFPTITPHDLRHTAVSMAISAGANVKAVQTMVGHASASMTLNTYADLFPDDLEAVAEALNKAALESVPNLCPDKKEALPA